MIFYKNDMTSIKKKIIFYISLLLFFAVSHIVFGAPFTIDILNLNETEPEAASAYLTPNKLHLKEVWDTLNADTSIQIHPVKIGILDDRIDTRHQEFNGTTTGAGIIGKVNFGNTPAFILTPPDFWGFKYFHGAAVTGIIGANNISASGGENYIFPQMNGVLSGVSRLDYTIELRSPKTPITFLFGAIGRMDDLINKKVQIINWAQEIYPFDAFLNKPFQSIKKRITNNPDILFVFAAGNDGVDAETSTPAKFGNLPNVITVGAVNNNDERAIFPPPLISSNFGNFVSISAPGLKVDAPGLTGYVAFSGTSASAPLVTGVAGLLKAIKPSLTPAEIKQILIRTADPIFAETGSDEAEMPLGSGCTATSAPQGMTKRGCRLNALAAVRQVLPTHVMWTSYESHVAYWQGWDAYSFPVVIATAGIPSSFEFFLDNVTAPVSGYFTVEGNGITYATSSVFASGIFDEHGVWENAHKFVVPFEKSINMPVGASALVVGHFGGGQWSGLWGGNATWIATLYGDGASSASALSAPMQYPMPSVGALTVGTAFPVNNETGQ
jgi:hypothetical protein